MHRALLGICLAMTAATGAAAAPLTGEWGGDRTRLTLTAAGAVLRQDCAEASFGPVAPDAGGRFSAAGRFAADGPGPQAGDAPAGGVAARFDGHVAGDTLHLTIRAEGAPPQRLTLVAGKQVKLIRCY